MPLSTQDTQTPETNFHAPFAIGTHDPRSQATADLRLGPPGHRDLQQVRITKVFSVAKAQEGSRAADSVTRYLYPCTSLLLFLLLLLLLLLFFPPISINPCFTMRYITGYLQCLQLGLLCYYVTAVGVAQGCLWALVLFWLVLQHV